MRSFAEYDTATGLIQATSTGGSKPTVPVGRAVVDITDRPEARAAARYDKARDAFLPQEPAPSRLSRFEFMSLLTPQERIALRQRAAAGDGVLADALDMLGLAAYVEVGHPLVTQMLDYAQSIGVMSAERRDAFVAAMDATA